MDPTQAVDGPLPSRHLVIGWSLIAIFNLLPIPILDGGHLTVIAVESVIRRDLPLKVKERILEVGFYLLILLMVVVLFNDIVRILPENVRQFIFRG